MSIPTAWQTMNGARAHVWHHPWTNVVSVPAPTPSRPVDKTTPPYRKPGPLGFCPPAEPTLDAPDHDALPGEEPLLWEGDQH